MFAAGRDCDGWRDNDGCKMRRQLLAEVISDDRVGSKRQVWAVLFARPKRYRNNGEIARSDVRRCN